MYEPLKYNIPIEVTLEEQKFIMFSFPGVCASRIDSNGVHYLTLWANSTYGKFIADHLNSIPSVSNKKQESIL